jgi:hypothetical protein
VGLEQGFVQKFEYVTFSNPQNTIYFQIFYTSKTTNFEDIFTKKFREITHNNTIINTYEKAISTTNVGINLLGK